MVKYKHLVKKKKKMTWIKNAEKKWALEKLHLETHVYGSTLTKITVFIVDLQKKFNSLLVFLTSSFPYCGAFLTVNFEQI